MKNNILLISDNLEISKILGKKLVLLRSCDEIKVSDYENAYSTAGELNPSLIFLHESKKRALTEDLLSILKTKCVNSSIILVVENIDTDFIMSMYDSGIDDYILSNADASEVLIKSVNLMKQKVERDISLRNRKLLENLGGISEATGFYTETYANEIFEDALTDLSFKNSVFMIVTYDELDRSNFSFEELANAVKNSVRASDLVVELSSGKFYILLADSTIFGAQKVFEKISGLLSGDFRIKAGICAVGGKDFKELEQKTASVLTDAMLSANDYAVYEEKEFLPDEDWTLEPESSQKDFKLFKNVFHKKLDNIITPVFFAMKEAYDGKIDGTIIEQFTNENQSIFHLKSRKQISRLALVYPGLGKVIIYITHSGLDSPENKEIVLTLKELSRSVLTEILESFINDYKTCIDSQEEK